jgi:hypothetical protein
MDIPDALNGWKLPEAVISERPPECNFRHTPANFIFRDIVVCPAHCSWSLKLYLSLVVLKSGQKSIYANLIGIEMVRMSDLPLLCEPI